MFGKFNRFFDDVKLDMSALDREFHAATSTSTSTNPNQRKTYAQKRPPVPRLPITTVKEDPLSKKLRRLDNANLVTAFDALGGVYINTNEAGVRQTAAILQNYPRVVGGVHIGFSGWHNFDIMANRKSARGVICDFNPENALFLHQILDLVRECVTKEEFVKKATKYVRKHVNAVIFQDTSDLSLCVQFILNVSNEPEYKNLVRTEEEVAVELKRETSWLYNDERYAHIRQLALQDKIALITEDICESATFARLGQTLQDNSQQVDTVYLSNISMYVDDKADEFVKTIEYLTKDKTTLVIDAHDLSFEGDPQQCVTTAKELPADMKAWFFPKAQSAPGYKA